MKKIILEKHFPFSRSKITDHTFGGIVELYIGGNFQQLEKSVQQHHPGFPLADGMGGALNAGVTYYSENPHTGDRATIVWVPKPYFSDPIYLMSVLAHESIHAAIKMLQKRMGITGEDIVKSEEVLAYLADFYFRGFAKAVVKYLKKHKLFPIGKNAGAK